jgi:hypothetical protein
MAKRNNKPTVPDLPGRFIPGYEDDQTHNGKVNIVMTDTMLRRVADELKQVKASLDEYKQRIDAIKAESRDPSNRYRVLLDAISSGTLSEHRDVWRFADDEAGTVSLYDALNCELLETRAMERWERQENLDFQNDDEDDDQDEDDE